MGHRHGEPDARRAERRGWFRKPRYRRLARFFPRWAMRRKIRKTYHHPVAEIAEGRFLDLGCGSGSCAALRGFFHGGYNVGLDLEVAPLRDSRQECRRLGISARYVAGDAFRLPFRDASFDTVYIGQVLEHLHGERAVVAEAARLLRPGGLLVVSVPQGESCGGAAAGHVNFYYSEDEVAKLLEGSPLRRERFHPFHRSRYFLSARREAASG